MLSRDVVVLEFNQLLEFSAEQLVIIIRTTLLKQPRFTCALAGGKSPEKLYQALGKYKKEKIWDKVHVFSTDERFVPANHDYNNFSMIRRNLLSAVPIPAKNCHPMPVDAKSAQVAAQQYESELKKFFNLKTGELPRFDLVLLGIGEDGHTASLFPNVAQWKENKKLVISFSHPKIDYERLSLTLAVLNNSCHAAFFVYGVKKADILYHILRTSEEFPSSCIQPQNGELHFWLDRDAGKKIHIP